MGTKKTASPKAQNAKFAKALSHLESGAPKKADQLLQKVLKADNTNADAFHLLGVARLQQGRLADAERFLSRALEIKPQDVGAFNNLGFVHMSGGNYKKAIEVLKRGLVVDGWNVSLLANLASSHFSIGDLEQAIDHAARCLEVAPSNVQALNITGLVHHWRKSDVAAREAFDQALKIDPTAFDPLKNLAANHFRAGDFKIANDLFQRALQQRPTDGEILCNLGTIQQNLGDFAAAKDLFSSALEAKPDLARAYYYLALLGDDDPARHQKLVAFAEQVGVPQRPSPANQTQAQLHFALYEAEHRRGRQEKALTHLELGNRAKRLTVNFSAEAHDSDIKKIIQMTGSTQKAAVATAGPAPVFVLGLPRSGTTLIEQVLASHSQAQAFGETSAFQNALSPLVPETPSLADIYDKAADFGAADWQQIADTYLKSLALGPGKTVGINKLPNNFLYLGLILRALPTARIIHIHRDPRDVCASLFSKLFTGAHDYAYGIEDLRRYHDSYAELMAHWNELHGDRIMNVGYENFVAHQRPETERLLQFAGLDWDEACMNFHDTERAISTASQVQVRQPLNSTSIGKWKEFEPLLTPLFKNLTSSPSPSGRGSG